MPYDYLPQLLQKSASKIVLLLLDGLGGLPIQAGGPTALEAAATPNMDRLASEGTLGQTIPIRAGITPGSGPAHLALFGYDPLVIEVGRGALEANGVGLDVHLGDVAARGNFCTLTGDGLISDRRAGRISSEEALPAIERLQSIQIPGVELEVRQVKEYRFAVVMRGEDLQPHLNDTDPQRTGAAPLTIQAQQTSAERAAELFNQFVAKARQVLADEPQANGITLRGFATDPQLQTYQDAYGLRAACVAVYPMYRGVSKLVGMDVIQFDGEYPEDEFAAVKKVWDDYDFFFIHIKKTDSMGEDGNFEGKAEIIESVDQALPELLALNPDVLLITGDHSTPAKMKSHSWHPVPFLLWAPATHLPDSQTQFGERACAQGGLGTFPAVDTMSLALAHAGRLNKYGA
ncbi:MAG: 2,3-bisphosphoglycerate-independent phosphoglycerate mutase [Chloroflexi bacterium]|nr:2,3-bisphosphoglycerate-independent phosphoglycerate mutase [Chloroflexota bacterium]MBL6965737.1 2,3-bisphosphoglycerate-independent phosphoglycerate mutase [Anaerolineales bacterium]